MSYPVPSNETKRLEALRRYGLLDTAPEPAFDDFAELASHICGTPVGLITLLDADRQWFKAQFGLSNFGETITETPRERAFCSHTILKHEVLVVEDATEDERFSGNPLVIDQPKIRFYAGAPLFTSDGYGLGALCVTDSVPRHLTQTQKRALEILARQVVKQFEYRRVSSDLATALADAKTLSGLLPMCGHCKNIRNDDGYWKSVEEYLTSHSEANFSHGVCPACAEAILKDFMASLPPKAARLE